MAWSVAGIADAIRSNRVEEAFSRSLLLLAAADQAAVDSGNWLLAQELLLKPAPPYASFACHSPPPAHLLQQTAAIDPRWMSVMMARTRERESFAEARRKLGGQQVQNSETAAEEKPQKPGPNKPQAKGKSKGKGKGDKGEETAEK